MSEIETVDAILKQAPLPEEVVDWRIQVGIDWTAEKRITADINCAGRDPRGRDRPLALCQYSHGVGATRDRGRGVTVVSLHDDLLEQARHLAKRERRRPRQASLRRSVSAAYYAVFHLLAHEGASMLAAGTRVAALRRMFTRGFAHDEMKLVSRAVARRQWPAKVAANVGVTPVPHDLVVVAERFLELQHKRHAADYDIMHRFSRGEVEALLDQADVLFQTWSHIRKEPAARIYLAALFAGRKIKA